MNKLLKKLPPGVQYIFLVYVSGMVVFSVLRLMLLTLHTGEVKEIPAGVILHSLFMGIRFDAVISGYFLILPAFLFFLFSFFGEINRRLASWISTGMVIIYSIAVLIHMADIRWFEHGAARFTVAALQWTNTPGWMLKFVFQDSANYPFLILLVVLIFVLSLLIRRIRRFAFENKSAPDNWKRNTGFFLLVLALMLLGMRGRLAQKSPIRWGTAFFSPYNFANQLGLNPVYTLIRSWLDKEQNKKVTYHYMDDEEAVKQVREQLGISEYLPDRSPVARRIYSEGNPRRFNVIIILMESMTAKHMQHFGCTENLTPVLDSLYDNAVSFSNFYSDGNHTFNGIYSSLYGWHSLPLVHHMKDLTHQQAYGGLPAELRSQGYRTVFFTTHDDQFDNMAGFLLPNGFEKIVSEKDYDRSEVLSTLGVPDHVMLDRVIKEMNVIHNNHETAFLGMITGSNHEPFVIPENIPFQPRTSEMADQIVEYSDWSIGRFFEEASKQPWFDSTIFVLTGDHGGLVKGYDHYLAFHHIPLIIFAPGIFMQPAVINSVGGQADIYATVCGILQLDYVNNSMGVDLLRQQRKFYPFNFDEELCCVSRENCFIIGHEQEQYYRLLEEKKRMEAIEKDSGSDSMKVFLEAAIQTTQRMIEARMMK